jgi:hypothetical protein
MARAAISLSLVLGACALLVGLTVGGYASTITPYVVTVEQVGSNVVATAAESLI